MELFSIEGKDATNTPGDDDLMDFKTEIKDSKTCPGHDDGIAPVKIMKPMQNQCKLRQTKGKPTWT